MIANVVDLPPIIERELRLVMKQGEPYKTRFLISLVAAGVVALMLMSSSRNLAERGNLIFRLLLLFSGYLAIVQPFGITADFLSRERRNQTLGLLFLTGLSPVQLFASKLAGGLMICLSNLVALLPVFAFPFLTGGVSFKTFAAAACLLPILLFFFTAFSLLGSSLRNDENQAMLFGVGMAAIVCLFAPAIYVICHLQLGIAIPRGLLLWSPLYGIYSIWIGFTNAVTWLEFMMLASVTLAYGFAALVGATFALSRAWKRECTGALDSVPGAFWWSRLFKWKTRRRMGNNPYAWLLERTPAVLPWSGLALCAIVWCILEIAVGNSISPLNRLFFAYCVNFFMIMLAIHPAVQRIAIDRQSGAFELLLTSPLSAKAIVNALVQIRGSRLQHLLLATLMLNVAIIILALSKGDWTATSTVSYVLAWLLVLLLSHSLLQSSLYGGIWIALNCGRSAYSLFKMIVPNARVLMSFWLLLTLFGSALKGFPNSSTGEWISLVLLLLVTLSSSAGQALIRLGKKAEMTRRLRFIARQPVPEPSDPRFKKWDTSQMFPFRKDSDHLEQQPNSAGGRELSHRAAG